MAQLQELNKSKPRNKVDENLIGEISRLESAITVTRDDLVSIICSVRSSIINTSFLALFRVHANCV